VNFSIVMAANYTDPITQIHIGEVYEFDGNPFVDPDLSLGYPDPRNDRWLKAVTPNTARVGWGIALDPLQGVEGDDRQGGRFLVLGTCFAKVVIYDEDHDYAERRTGERVLHSTATKSACKILDKPDGTAPDERLCHVQIMDEPGDTVDIVQVDDAGSHGDVIIRDMSIRPAYQGKIKRYNPSLDALDDLGYCWVLFVDDYEQVAFDTAVINGEHYGPAKYVGRETFDFAELPTYIVRRGEMTEMLQVYHPAAEGEEDPPAAGNVVAGLAAGYHPGFVVRYNDSSTLAVKSACWIQFHHKFNSLAIQGEYYGPGKYAGIFDLVQNAGEETETHDRRPVYVLECSERFFPGRFEAAIADGSSGTFTVYHPETLEPSGITVTAYCHGDAIIEGKGFIQLGGRRWWGGNSECSTSPPPEDP
jgi:hypothetical protein